VVVTGAMAGLAGEMAIDVSVGVGPGTNPLLPPPGHDARNAVSNIMLAKLYSFFMSLFLADNLRKLYHELIHGTDDALCY